MQLGCVETMNKEIRIIVAGYREFNDYTFVKSKIHELLFRLIDEYEGLEKSDIRFISGTCRGVDKLGERYANEYGYKLSEFPANWKLYHNSAGYERNKQMADFAVQDGSIGILLAFTCDKSKGTKLMIDLAKKNGLEVNIVEI